MAIWALAINLLMPKTQRRSSCHLHAEPIRLSQAAPATRPVLRHALSRLLHASKRLGTALDHAGLIAPRMSRIEIASQITQHRLVFQQPHHDPGATPEPSAPQ